MNKEKVAEFFDKWASAWDADLIRNDKVIDIILEKGGIKEKISVLDVASGTGVLFGDYRKKGVASLTGIDISSNMVEIARNKFPWVNMICGDAESYVFSESYDAIMIYNAFPHFASPEKLFQNLTTALKEKGRLTVAHGMSREDIQKCHEGAAREISLPLPEVNELAGIMSTYIDVDVVISDSEMYMVSGVKKQH